MVKKTIAGILSALILMGTVESSTTSKNIDLEQMLASVIKEETASNKPKPGNPWQINKGRIYSVDEEEISYLVTDEKGNTYPQTLYFELCTVHYENEKKKWHWARMVIPGRQLIKEMQVITCKFVPLPERLLSYQNLVAEYGVEGVDYRTQKGGLLVDGIMLIGGAE